MAPDVLDRAVDAMESRGPDDRGVWSGVDARAGREIHLGHRRLSILDLSTAGHQPMHSADGQITIVYNGEVYNFREIREELEGLRHRFRSNCDTEVLIAAYQQWGTDFVHRCNGMFALAIWDSRAGKVSLFRDRVGIKPLYLGQQDGRFYFASVLNAMAAIPGFRREVDHEAQLAYLSIGYVPGPYAMYAGIRKLQSGHMATYDLATGSLETRPYWQVAEVAAIDERTLPERPVQEYVDELEELLKDAVRLCLVSDVDLGAFLSGGIDSSLVAALMTKVHPGVTRTFSIGFDVDAFNEAPMAKAVAASLGTQHEEQILTADEVRRAIDDVPKYYDEPFSDSSCLPTMLLSRMTRRHVTVALSGDGGDETFWGDYSHYRTARRWGWARKWPPMARKLMATGLCPLRGPRFEHLRRAFTRDLDNYYYLSTAICNDSVVAELAKGDLPSVLERLPHEEVWKRLRPYGRNPVLVASTLDFYGLLPDDFLVKVDRASMACSLEVRVPLLDYRVVEYSRRLPCSIVSRMGRSKYLLKEILSRHVPRELWDRSKKGFGVPLAVWFRNELYDYARERLLDHGVLPFDVLNRAKIEEMIEIHRSGRRDLYRVLWGLLSLSLWYEHHLNSPHGGETPSLAGAGSSKN